MPHSECTIYKEYVAVAQETRNYTVQYVDHSSATNVQLYAHTCTEVTLQYLDYAQSSYIHSCSSRNTRQVTPLFRQSSRHRIGISEFP